MGDIIGDPSWENLPELTEKERAVLDAYTPDFFERLLREVGSGKPCDELETQKVDALAKAIITGGTMPSLADMKTLAARHLDLLALYEQNNTRLLESLKRSMKMRAFLKRQLDELQKAHPGGPGPEGPPTA